MFEYKTWRTERPHEKDRTRRGQNEDIPATKFFDNLSFIGNTYVGCFLIETSDGLIMLDNMCRENVEYVEQGIISLGYDPAMLKAILISHGHGDHFGNAGYFAEKYGTRIYMSERDAEYSRDPKSLPPGAPLEGMRDFEIQGYIEDKQIFRLGNMWVDCRHTPGHTPGCMSFIFPVYDEGREHIATLWGGTGARKGDVPALEQHIRSSLEFTEAFMQYGADVAISTHPFVDNSPEKLALCRNLKDGVPNPFIMGKDALCRFQSMYTTLYRSALEALL